MTPRADPHARQGSRVDIPRPERIAFQAMLKLDLVRLERVGTLPVEADVPADADLFQGSELRFEDGLRVRLRAQHMDGDQVVVRGTLEGTQLEACRRCLDLVRVPVTHEVTFVFAPPDELEPDDAGGEVRELSPRESELDLSEAVREELILRTNRYVVCRPDCKGLCPSCGRDLNDESCECTLEEPDPRWDALRALKND